MIPRSVVAGAVLALAGTSALAMAAGATAAPKARTVLGVRIVGTTALSEVRSRTVFIDRGTVTGSPVGSGSITLRYQLNPTRGVAVTTFTITNRRGTVSGRCLSDYAVTRLHITFTGAGGITGGTGAYRGITGRPLEFNAVHSATGKRELISLLGRATTP